MTNAVQTTNIHNTSSAGIVFGVIDSWMVAAGVIVASDTNDGVFSNVALSYLDNRGDIAGGNSGVTFTGSIGHILNEADGSIEGGVGIAVAGTGDYAVNDGSVTGQSAGFVFQTTAQLSGFDNRGRLFAWGTGVLDHSTSGGHDFIRNSGTIEGLTFGIDIDTGAGSVTAILNSGTIAGLASVHVGSSTPGAVHLTNTGTLIGDVSLQSNQNDGDTVVNSGHILAPVSLGGGDDSFTGIGGTSGEVFGQAGNDHLIGGSGADKLSGGLDADTLTGGPGGDHFVFDVALGAGNVDHITDFHHGIDKFELKHAFFPGTNASGTLAAAMFFAGSAAHDTGDRIIYNPVNGRVYFDQDGSGHAHAAILFATLTAHLAMTNVDFLVVT